MATNRTNPAPMQGVRVINLGSQWAGRLTSMLLADQGADVLEIAKPDRPTHPVDAMLDRGKRVRTVDLKDEAVCREILETARDADIVIENMRVGAVDGLGLDFTAFNGADVVYISQPGFAAGDPNRDAAAWEGSINASVGVYTDIAPLGPWIGGAPVYSAIPMASAYGGVLGAVAASLGYFHKQRTGKGQRIEVPLADAVFAAMALLIAEIDGQPSRYNFPPVDNEVKDMLFPVLRQLQDHMDPEQKAMINQYLRNHGSFGLRSYEASDGRLVFVCTPDHVIQTHAFLRTLGVYDQAIAEGMIAESAYSERTEGNNLYKSSGLRPEWRQKLVQMIENRIRTKPAAEWEKLLRDAKVPVTVVQTCSEWLANQAYRDAGITTDIEDPDFGTARTPGRFISIEGSGTLSPDLKPAQRSSSGSAWDTASQSAAATIDAAIDPKGGMLQGLKVLDFSNIIAGPAAGRTLAEHGAEVIRIDAPAPQAGPYATMWFGIDVNQGKRAIILDLKTQAGREALAPLVREADIVLHNFLDKSARSLGIAHDQLEQINPDIISCQVSAWGGTDGGAYKDDPAFDPVLQAASGITTRFGNEGQPTLHGIASCVDYITGFSAMLGIVQALVAKANGYGGSYVRTALALGTQMVQFPYMIATEGHQPGAEPGGQSALGDGIGQSFYEVADGWAFVGFREGSEPQFAECVGAPEASETSLRNHLRSLPLAELQTRLKALPGSSAIAPRSLPQIRADRTIDGAQPLSNWANSGSHLMRRGPHPSGYITAVPVPTWVRPEDSVVSELFPAPAPGEHTSDVLRETGMADETIASMLKTGEARSGWAVLNHYLPT